MRKTVGREAIAVSLPILACILQFLAWKYLSPLHWVLFYPAVFYSSLIGSRASGIIAVIEATLLGWFVFLPIDGGVSVTSYSIGTVVFCVTGLIFVIFHQHLAGLVGKAHSANRAKSDFLAAMSHEIRTPLGIIMGYSELLQDGNVDRPGEKLYGSVIYRSAQNLLSIINDILDLSKVESGKMLIKTEEVDLLEVLSDIFIEFSHAAAQKGLSFTVKIIGQIPGWIFSDSTRLRQILVNLVGNAMKFTEKGSIEVRVSHCKEKSKVRFTVSDSGRGIAEQDRSVIFEPFRQAESGLKRKYGGTGLGLPLSRKMARSLGGDVDLKRTAPGDGSEFEATVSVGKFTSAKFVTDSDLQGAIQLRSRNLKTTSPKSQQKPLGGKNILVVDDSEDLQDLLELVLKDQGALVDRAMSAPEGIEKAKRLGPYDMILMDIQMPGMTGYDAVSKLRKSNYRAPIIALTANAMKGEYERCREAGFDDYLSKPVKFDTLVEAMTRHIAEAASPATENHAGF